MQLQLQSFGTIVSNAAAAVQGSARQLLDLTVGSTLRAILEANAGLALWIQWLIVQVLATTRAATSVGPDLDTWVQDFSSSRLPASQAAGQVTLSRFTPSLSALIPPGTMVKTADGSQSFVVTTDPTNPAWSPNQAAYVVGQGVGSINVPVHAIAAGAIGNVQPGAITTLSSAIAGIDTVSNATALSGGLDSESDDALRARFTTYLASRARATPIAIANAVLSVQQGLAYVLEENAAPGGVSQVGSFVVTVDDGSGAPPATLLQNVASAIESVRPIGSIYSVQPPTVSTANVSLFLTAATAAAKPTAIANVATALTNQINALPIGAQLPWSRLSQIAYSADSNVANVTSILLNGGTSDLTVPPNGLVRAGSIQVN